MLAIPHLTPCTIQVEQVRVNHWKRLNDYSRFNRTKKHCHRSNNCMQVRIEHNYNGNVLYLVAIAI